LLWAVLTAAVLRTDGAYSVIAQRVNGQRPIFPRGTSIFDYNYNPAFIPRGESFSKAGLLVRCQNNASNPQNPWAVTPSNLAWSQLAEPFDINDLHFHNIASESIVMAPAGSSDNYGDEDPRVVYRESDGLYYLLYSAVEQKPTGDLFCRLSLATSPTPAVASSWKRVGPLFPDESWSKSGALLIRDDTPAADHILFFGDSNKVPGLQTARSVDLLHWQLNSTVWLPIRSDHFDSYLVEAGPMPMRLSDGNYFMIYNSARSGFPSPNPGYNLQYNIGYIILDGNDPMRILERSEHPLLSPQLDWEKNGLTAHVVFAEGWYRIHDDTFLVFYGAADTYVGAAVVSVFVSERC